MSEKGGRMGGWLMVVVLLLCRKEGRPDEDLAAGFWEGVGHDFGSNVKVAGVGNLAAGLLVAVKWEGSSNS